MPVIDGITIDVEWWTADSESSPRTMILDTLQPHHAATTSLNGARALMDPGGRTVSSNGLLDTDGTLYGVVHPSRRAFTSATTFDNRSFTVECVNSSGSPTWGLTDAQHRRLGQIAREIAARRGVPVSRDRIVQHKDVPGTYATACAGPEYNGEAVYQYAIDSQEEEDTMKQYQAFGRGFAAGPGKIIMNTGPQGEEAMTAFYGPVVENFGGAELFWADGKKPSSAVFTHPAAVELSAFLQILGIPGDFSTWVGLKSGQFYQTPVGASADIDEEALARELANLLPAGITEAKLRELIPTAKQNALAVRAEIIK